MFESLAALFIMGVFLTAILTSQGTILGRIYRYHNEIDRIPLLNNLFFNPDNHASILKEEPVSSESLSPVARLRLAGNEPIDSSSLHGLKGLRVLQAEAMWDEVDGDVSMVASLLMFDKAWIKSPEES